MSSPRPSPLPLVILALVAVMLLSFFAAIPWLKQQSDGLVFLFAGIATTLSVVGGVSFSVVSDRQLDEWQRSAARFSSQWGWNAGACLVALLLALPPIQDLLVSGAAIWGGVPHPDRRLVLTTFTFGFVAVVVAQSLSTVLLNLGWVFWKSRSVRET